MTMLRSFLVQWAAEAAATAKKHGNFIHFSRCKSSQKGAKLKDDLKKGDAEHTMTDSHVVNNVLRYM